MNRRTRAKIRLLGPFRRLGRRATATLVVLLAYTGVPQALAEQRASPPEQESPWLQWLLVLVFAALCCAVAFKNPKRSHMS
ncbi:MAG: hypothetical protein ACYSUI_22680 [Planctomycetota bacterium]|jgi:hypothetical protein